MRVLVLTDDHPPMGGGVAAWTGRVAEELVARGHDVRVLARARDGLRPIAGTRLTPVRGPSFGRHGGLWLGLRGLGAALAADLVLATTWPVATLVSRTGVPLSIVAHGSDLTGRRPDLRVWSRASGRTGRDSYTGHIPSPLPLSPQAGRGEKLWCYPLSPASGERAGVRGSIAL